MANKYNLTEGSLGIIMSGGEVADPVMQVLGSKKMASATTERYRIVLSDGRNTISFAMLTTSPEQTFRPGDIDDNSIIKVKKYITSVIDNSAKNRPPTRILLILNLDIVAHGSEVGRRLGAPVPLGDGLSGTSKTGTEAKPVSSTSTSVASASSSNKPTGNGVAVNAGSSTTEVSSRIDFAGRGHTPILALSPYHNKYLLKARVMTKSMIKTWSNDRGEGKLFSVELMDESGEIRVTFFKEQVDKWYDMLEVDKVYYINKCQVKSANKKFNSLNNDYELTSTSETMIELCNDVEEVVPKITYNFVPINKILGMAANEFIDVIGVCKSIGTLQVFTAKTTNKEMKKRELLLIDQTNTSVALVLWSTDAENFDEVGNPVVVVKRGRINEFGGGKSVVLASSNQMKINPDIPEVIKMKAWYDSEGCNAEVKNISARTDGSAGSFPWMTFREVRAKKLGQSDKGDYYQNVATILMMRTEKAIYKACPAEECNKKVVDLENGMYRCEKCNREYPNFKYRLLASINLGDYCSHQWVNMFSSEVEKVLGVPAQQVGEMVDQDPEAIFEYADNVHFKQFTFKCRAKMECYNDENRLKTVAVRVEPVNFVEHNKYMIEQINIMLRSTPK